MRILLVAPHPFFTPRGTPMTVKLVCEALSGLGHTVDVLTYHEGRILIAHASTFIGSTDHVSFGACRSARHGKKSFATSLSPGA